MSRVQVDLTAGRLAQEATLPRSPITGGDSSGAGSFGRHLEQAQRLAAAPSDPRPEPPSGPVPPAPSEGSAQQAPGKPPHDDPPADQHPVESQPSTAAADDSENASSGQEQQPTADDRHDTDDDSDRAADASPVAGAATAAAQAGRQRTEKVLSHGGNEKPARPVESARVRTNSHPAQTPAKKQTEAGEEGLADANSAEAQVAETAAASKTGVDVVPAAGEEAGQAGSSRSSDRTDLAESKRGQPDAVSAGNQPGAAVPGIAVPPVPSERTPETRAPEAEVANQAAPPVTGAAPQNPTEVQPTQHGSRRTETSVGAPQSGEPEVQAAVVDENSAVDSAERPVDSGTARTEGPSVDDKRELAASRDPADRPATAKMTDSAASQSVPSHASDAVGQRTGEGAGGDAADRARFVQRVARAFESAADRGGHVRLRLYPPELGSLRLDLSVRGGLLSARLEAETESARNMLLENLPALKERLAGHRIQVERFDIEWRGNAQGGLPQRSGDSDRWQPPLPGRAARIGGAVQAGSGPEGAGTARRINPGTSFDVLI